METRIQNGYLLLADLSGFTRFMASAELEHAQEIVTELIDLVCSNIKPVFKIAEIEGDAVFAYASENQFSRGETLLEIVELTYYNFTFRKNIMQEKSTCGCKACSSIREVDLKFVIHFGSFAMQNYSGSIKPLGSDVNLSHRFLKNSVNEKLGLKHYALLTENCLRKTELPADIFIPVKEYYEHFGDVNAFVIDLSESFKKIAGTKRIIIKEEDADFISEYQFEMPSSVLWEWLVDNSKRELWMEKTSWKKGDRPEGRTAAGATNHCIHGKDEHLEIILDWKPFDYYTYEIKSKPLFLISTVKLVENEKGTRLVEVTKLKNKIPRFLRRLILKIVLLKIMKVYDSYKTIERLAAKQPARQEEI